MGYNQNQENSVNGVNTLVFDIVGTLLDSVGTIQSEITDVFINCGIDEHTAQDVAYEWNSKQSSFPAAIASGQQPWMLEDDIRRHLLESILESRDILLNQDDFERLATVGRRFRPWPEASRQLNELGSLITTTGLTNSGFTQIIEACTHAELRWHALLSTQFAQTYKPEPAAYKLAIDMLGIVPQKTIFISTHPWDLRAAASHGFRTAYLPREHAQTPAPNDQFNLTLQSLDDLIVKLRNGE
ncbi:HAD-IA family hydrolase [Oceanobacillus sp. CFH 90083]|uniref:HAD-IA family hydrolase n=1 Tax=Oceanobacillus sp. CFH 90083 TaxID=2592336 RepID=UPI00128D5A83|nr:HAD-IA family hydrolase [Oceanobacillus sp. CFH 90083]